MSKNFDIEKSQSHYFCDYVISETKEGVCGGFKFIQSKIRCVNMMVWYPYIKFQGVPIDIATYGYIESEHFLFISILMSWYHFKDMTFENCYVFNK